MKLLPAKFHEIRLSEFVSTIWYSFGTKEELAPCLDFLDEADSSSDNAEWCLLFSFLIGWSSCSSVAISRMVVKSEEV